MESPDQGKDYGLLVRELSKDLDRFPLELHVHEQDMFSLRLI